MIQGVLRLKNSSEEKPEEAVGAFGEIGLRSLSAIKVQQPLQDLIRSLIL
jgi:hypothetical protein